jgi:hypothetical protein
MEPEQPKSIVLPIISSVLISAVIFGAAGYYFGTVNKTITSTQVSSPTASVTTNSPTPLATTSASTASPKTFTSTKYNFTITYPSTWTLRNSPEEIVNLISPETNQGIEAEKKVSTLGVEGWDNDVTIYYYVSVVDYTKEVYKGSIDQSLQTLTTLKDLMGKDSLLKSEKLIDFAGVKAYEVGNNSDILDDHAVYVEHDGHLYVLHEAGKGAKNTHSADNQKIFDSFKFTK